MSCGNPHETDCSEVLNHLYEYLDNEMGDGDCAKLRQHFLECSPCLEAYGLEQAVKALVRRACGCDDMPSDLRGKVLTRIERIRDAVPVAGGPAEVGLADESLVVYAEGRSIEEAQARSAHRPAPEVRG